MSKIYPYKTGNLELMERVNAGESIDKVMEEISTMWKPGNEYMWDEYDTNSLISGEKGKLIVNALIYERITLYRKLRDKGIDIKGKDPMKYKDGIDGKSSDT